MYRSAAFALDPLLDRYAERRHKERSRVLVGQLLRRSAAVIAAVLLLCALVSGRGADGQRSVHCLVIVDRSRLPPALSDSLASAFNAYVAKQAAEDGRMLMTLALADEGAPLELAYEARDVRRVPPLQRSDLHSRRGRTSLPEALAAAMPRVQRDSNTQPSDLE